MVLKDSHTEWLAAIDGGGTKTWFVLCSPDGRVHRRVLRGASNPFDIGFDACRDLLQDGLTELLSDVGGLDAPLAACFAGLAGGSSGGSDAKLREFMSTLLPGSITGASSDMINAISSGIYSGEGCTVIAGTGSSAFARVNGELFRSGGWGYLLDGAGSGYDLGCGAIRAALRAGDGRDKPGVLSTLLEEAIGESAADHLRVFYDKGKRYIASFAPLVFKACDEGDPFALSLVAQTADYLSEIISAVCRSAGLAQTDVVCIGGLFNRRDILLPLIQRTLPAGLNLIFPDAPPVYGAAAEAARLAGLSPAADFKENFMKTWED